MNFSLMIILLCMTLIISGMSIQVGYSQEEKNYTKTESPSSTSQKWVNGYAELNATDFSLKYPIGWNVYYSSSSRDYESYTIEHPVNGSFDVLITPYDVSGLPTSGLIDKSIQVINDSNLPEIFPSALKIIQSGFEIGVPSQPEEISYDKYTVDGHRTGSTQFNVSYKDFTARVLGLVTIVDNKVFAFAYGVRLDQFDWGLPTIKEIIETVEV
jgi:hypothetical protein